MAHGMTAAFPTEMTTLIIRASGDYYRDLPTPAGLEKSGPLRAVQNALPEAADKQLPAPLGLGGRAEDLVGGGEVPFQLVAGVIQGLRVNQDEAHGARGSAAHGPGQNNPLEDLAFRVDVEHGGAQGQM